MVFDAGDGAPLTLKVTSFFIGVHWAYRFTSAAPISPILKTAPAAKAVPVPLINFIEILI